MTMTPEALLPALAPSAGLVIVPARFAAAAVVRSLPIEPEVRRLRHEPRRSATARGAP